MRVLQSCWDDVIDALDEACVEQPEKEYLEFLRDVEWEVVNRIMAISNGRDGDGKGE